MFAEALRQTQAAVQAALDRTLAGQGDLPLHQAMRYSLQGGKRLRAFLVLESAALHGVPVHAAMPAAEAVEMLHAYSLIHDDLPCMDDDDLRRGLPTVHVRWNEATAVLAGDALQALAFERCCDPALGTPERRLRLVAALARASGHEGMVLGQALDMAAETAPAPLTLSEITRMQAGKTGALIGFAAESGAILAAADVAPLTAYAQALGLAFQIADDLLDVAGDPAKAGKALGKDAGAGKATFVSLLGLDGARARAHDLIEEAVAALDGYGAAAGNLREAARFVIARET